MWNSGAPAAQTFSCASPESRGRQVLGGDLGAGRRCASLSPELAAAVPWSHESHGELSPGCTLSSPRYGEKRVVVEGGE